MHTREMPAATRVIVDPIMSGWQPAVGHERCELNGATRFTLRATLCVYALQAPPTVVAYRPRFARRPAG
jgi:hypothetical protein